MVSLEFIISTSIGCLALACSIGALRKQERTAETNQKAELIVKSAIYANKINHLHEDYISKLYLLTDKKYKKLEMHSLPDILEDFKTKGYKNTFHNLEDIQKR